MRVAALAELTAPISEDDPCGPDLDMGGDADYMNFVAHAEGLLPDSFFSFDRKSIDVDEQAKTIALLLRRTRDLRLLAILAKLLVLDRDLDGFCRTLEAMAVLLQMRWDEVNPRSDEADFAVRAAVLQSLDDPAVTVLPLQYVPLVETRRIGSIHYRQVMVATGDAAPRAGEERLDLSTIERELMDAELDKLIDVRDRLLGAQASFALIRETWLERAGYDQAVAFERALPLLGKMAGFLEAAIVKRDASAAAKPAAVAEDKTGEPAGAAPKPATASRVKSFQDAAAALSAVARYFSRFEPSNPALLLVHQAEQLIGRSFVEVLRVLVPAAVDKATVRMQGGEPLALSLERLDAQFRTDEAGEGRQDASASGPFRWLRGDPTAEPPLSIAVETRDDAMALLGEVAQFYRVREPSSPIPLLAEEARSLSSRDFTSLLEHLLRPPNAAGAK